MLPFSPQKEADYRIISWSKSHLQGMFFETRFSTPPKPDRGHAKPWGRQVKVKIHLFNLQEKEHTPPCFPTTDCSPPCAPIPHSAGKFNLCSKISSDSRILNSFSHLRFGFPAHVTTASFWGCQCRRGCQKLFLDFSEPRIHQRHLSGCGRVLREAGGARTHLNIRVLGT